VKKEASLTAGYKPKPWPTGGRARGGAQKRAIAFLWSNAIHGDTLWFFERCKNVLVRCNYRFPYVGLGEKKKEGSLVEKAREYLVDRDPMVEWPIHCLKKKKVRKFLPTNLRT